MPFAWIFAGAVVVLGAILSADAAEVAIRKNKVSTDAAVAIWRNKEDNGTQRWIAFFFFATCALIFCWGWGFPGGAVKAILGKEGMGVWRK